MAFRINSVTAAGHRYQFCHKQSQSSYITLLVGRNGTGKSRLLAEICRAFDIMDSRVQSSPTDIRAPYPQRPDLEMEITRDAENARIRVSKRKIETDKAIWLEHIRPSRVIATTITPFDKFPINRRTEYENSNSNSRYRYLGSKNALGQFSGSARLSRTIESLISASDKGAYQRYRISHVFDFLGYEPLIIAEYRLRFRSEIAEPISDSLRKGDIEKVANLIRALDSPFKHRLRAAADEPSYELFEAASAIAGLSHASERSKPITFRVDFSSGDFQSGSLEQYRYASLLRKYGLVSLRSLKLVRASDHHPIEIRDASSGEQSVVLTLLGIASQIENDSLVIIDEPEISLHPEWQERFVPMLLQTFEHYTGCHFVLATHSPQLLASTMTLPNGSVVLMDSAESYSTQELPSGSADYQLATAFRAPGYGNEYLARRGLNALASISKGKWNDPMTQNTIALMRLLRPRLKNEDPVALLADALISASEIKK